MIDTPARRSLVSEPRKGTARAVRNPPRAAQREDMDSLQNTSSGGCSRSHPSSPAGSAAFGENVISGRPHLAGAHPHRPQPTPPGRAWARGARGAPRAAQEEGHAGAGEAPPAPRSPAAPGSQAPPGGLRALSPHGHACPAHGAAGGFTPPSPLSSRRFRGPCLT